MDLKCNLVQKSGIQSICTLVSFLFFLTVHKTHPIPFLTVHKIPSDSMEPIAMIFDKLLLRKGLCVIHAGCVHVTLTVNDVNGLCGAAVMHSCIRHFME